MSAPRYAKRRDASEPDQVKALRGAGWEVTRHLPVDLLCHRIVTLDQLLRVLKRGDGYLLVLPMECKTAYGKKDPKAKLDKRQKEQIEYCERWKIPKPTDGFEALLAVGEKVTL